MLACEAAGDDVHGSDRDTLDVTDRDAVLGAITSIRPDAIIHCAAWTAVDACESDVDRAFAANALAVRWVAEGCARTGAHLVAISTDYVFDGTKVGPYHEWDVTNPTSVYGASKLAGEHEALALGTPRPPLFVPAGVCGEHGNNMVKTIMRLAVERDSLAFVAISRAPVVVRRCRADAAPARARPPLGCAPRHEPGCGQLVRVRPAVVTAMGKSPAMVTPITTADLQPPAPGHPPGEQRARQRGAPRRRPTPAARLPRVTGEARHPPQRVTSSPARAAGSGRDQITTFA